MEETRIGKQGTSNCITHSCIHQCELNAGMGNTDTIHPISCYFSIPTSRINFVLLVCIVFMHMHILKHATSTDKLSQTNTIVKKDDKSAGCACLVCAFLLRFSKSRWYLCSLLF